MKKQTILQRTLDRVALRSGLSLNPQISGLSQRHSFARLATRFSAINRQWSEASFRSVSQRVVQRYTRFNSTLAPLEIYWPRRRQRPLPAQASEVNRSLYDPEIYATEAYVPETYAADIYAPEPEYYAEDFAAPQWDNSPLPAEPNTLYSPADAKIEIAQPNRQSSIVNRQFADRPAATGPNFTPLVMRHLNEGIDDLEPSPSIPDAQARAFERGYFQDGLTLNPPSSILRPQSSNPSSSPLSRAMERLEGVYGRQEQVDSTAVQAENAPLSLNYVSLRQGGLPSARIETETAAISNTAVAPSIARQISPEVASAATPDAPIARAALPSLLAENGYTASAVQPQFNPTWATQLPALRQNPGLTYLQQAESADTENNWTVSASTNQGSNRNNLVYPRRAEIARAQAQAANQSAPATQAEVTSNRSATNAYSPAIGQPYSLEAATIAPATTFSPVILRSLVSPNELTIAEATEPESNNRQSSIMNRKFPRPLVRVLERLEALEAIEQPVGGNNGPQALTLNYPARFQAIPQAADYSEPSPAIARTPAFMPVPNEAAAPSVASSSAASQADAVRISNNTFVAASPTGATQNAEVARFSSSPLVASSLTTATQNVSASQSFAATTPATSALMRAMERWVAIGTPEQDQAATVTGPGALFMSYPSRFQAGRRSDAVGAAAFEPASLVRPSISTTTFESAPLARILVGATPLESALLAARATGEVTQPSASDFNRQSVSPIERALERLAFNDNAAETENSFAGWPDPANSGLSYVRPPLVGQKAELPGVSRLPDAQVGYATEAANLPQPSPDPLASTTPAELGPQAGFVGERLSIQNWAATLPALRQNPGIMQRADAFETAEAAFPSLNFSPALPTQPSQPKRAGATPPTLPLQRQAESFPIRPIASKSEAASTLANSWLSDFEAAEAAPLPLTHKRNRVALTDDAAVAAENYADADDDGSAPAERQIGVLGTLHPATWIQRKSSDGSAAPVAPIGVKMKMAATTILRTTSGKPLDSAVQTNMGRIFRTNFENVRVHTDDHSAGHAAEIGAEAFTVGSNIFFAPGRYQPHTPIGQALIGHELTHVVQQASLPSLGQGRVPETSAAGQALEHEAINNERLIMRHLSNHANNQAAESSSGADSYSYNGSNASLVERNYASLSSGNGSSPQGWPVQRELVGATSAPASTAPANTGAAPESGENKAKKQEELEKMAEQIFRMLKHEMMIERERGGTRGGLML